MWSCEDSLSLSGMCRRRKPIYDEMACFQVKECWYLCNNFMTVYLLEILFPSLNEAKNCKIYLGWPQTSCCFWNKRNLFCRTSFCSIFLICNNIFPLFYQCRLFYFRDAFVIFWRTLICSCRSCPVCSFLLLTL